MFGTHICFMAQANKEAERSKKKEIMTAMRSMWIISWIAVRITVGSFDNNKITFRNGRLRSSGINMLIQMIFHIPVA